MLAICYSSISIKDCNLISGFYISLVIRHTIAMAHLCHFAKALAYILAAKMSRAAVHLMNVKKTMFTNLCRPSLEGGPLALRN